MPWSLDLVSDKNAWTGCDLFSVSFSAWWGCWPFPHPLSLIHATICLLMTIFSMAFAVGSHSLTMVSPKSKALAISRASDHRLSPHGKQEPRVLTPPPSAQPCCFYSGTAISCYYIKGFPGSCSPYLKTVSKRKVPLPLLFPQLMILLWEFTQGLGCHNSCTSPLFSLPPSAFPAVIPWLWGKGSPLFHSRDFSDAIFWFSPPQDLQSNSVTKSDHRYLNRS